MQLINFLQLMRMHKPIGIVLLWSPTAWALWVANDGNPPLYLVYLFCLGTILMRAAGCVINDIADRNIDWQVNRTQQRPLTAGIVSLKEAFSLLFFLLLSAFIILLQLPKTCIYYGVIAVLVTFVYPFCKRFMHCPQLILGIAFSMGIPMAFCASNALINNSTIYLLIINFCWIVAYDTQYAMADREDDLRIGVRSTAIFFAHYDKTMVGLLQAICHLTWYPLAILQKFSMQFWLLWGIAGIILIYQQLLIANRSPNKCFQAFIYNGWYGAIMWLAIILSHGGYS